MIRTPYDARICQSYLINDTVEKLKGLYIQGSLVPSTVKGTRKRIYLLADKAIKTVSAFTHPMLVNVGDHDIFVLDARGLITENKITRELRPTKGLIFQDLRAALMLATWMEGDGKKLLDAGDIQIKVFSRLIADNLTQRLELDEAVRGFLQVISAYYYFCLHVDKDNFDQDMRARAIRAAGHATGFPMSSVMETLDETPHLGNLGEFADYITMYGPGTRIQKANLGWFYDYSLSGIWFEHNAKELVAVALEHPPTFSAMLYTATNDKSYRNTILSKILEKVDRRRDESELFRRNIERYWASDL